MSNLANLNDALIAVQDPRTSAENLAVIAQLHANLRKLVAVHPNAYPGLLDWLDRLGDPDLSLIVASRRVATTQSSAHAQISPSPEWSVASSPAYVQLAHPQGRRRHGTSLIRKHRTIAVIIPVLVVVVALVITSLVFMRPAPAFEPWVKTYGPALFNGVVVTPNGNIVAVGAVGGSSSADGDFSEGSGTAAELKMTPDGTLPDFHSFGGTNGSEIGGCPPEFFAVTATPDNGVIAVGGATCSTEDDFAAHGGGDAVVAKLDPHGNMTWGKTFGGSGPDVFSAVTITQDGSIVAAGCTNSADGDFPGNGDQSTVLIKLTPDGELIWSKVLNGADYSYFHATIGLPDGSIIAVGDVGTPGGDFLTGNSSDKGGTSATCFECGTIVKFNNEGTVMWARNLSDHGDFSALALAQDGNVVVAGSTNASTGEFRMSHGGQDASIAEIDPDGNVVWAKAYGGSGGEYFNSLTIAHDGGIVAVGATDSNDGDFPSRHGKNDAVVAGFDSGGNLQWAKTYGGTDDDSLNSVAIAQDGDIVAAGDTSSPDGDFPLTRGTHDAVLMRLNADGTLDKE